MLQMLLETRNTNAAAESWRTPCSRTGTVTLSAVYRSALTPDRVRVACKAYCAALRQHRSLRRRRHPLPCWHSGNRACWAETLSDNQSVERACRLDVVAVVGSHPHTGEHRSQQPAPGLVCLVAPFLLCSLSALPAEHSKHFIRQRFSPGNPITMTTPGPCIMTSIKL